MEKGLVSVKMVGETEKRGGEADNGKWEKRGRELTAVSMYMLWCQYSSVSNLEEEPLSREAYEFTSMLK